MDILIGHTGFVGSNLLKGGRKFEAYFNSSNINSIAGGSYGTVICAGVSAVKWLANKEPEADWSAIQSLISNLATIRAERFILISTIDVYPRPVGVSEADLPVEGDEAYGRHRLRLEAWVRDHFNLHHVLRLPGLFGHGLKKNVIFDLINGNNVQHINPDSRFQWYPIDRLSQDVDRVIAAEVRTLNVSPEPVITSHLIHKFFPHLATLITSKQNPVTYDMQTLYAGVLGGHGAYHISAADVVEAMQTYIADIQGRR